MAQVRALFISEKFIKNNAEIDDNVDMKKLLPTVWWCQKAYIEKTLGSPLFEDLMAKVIAGTLAGNDLTLVEAYISDALLAWFMHEAQVPLLYNYRNKSVGKSSSDNSQPIDYTEHRYLKDYYKPRAEYYSQRLDEYLCANTTLFPLYTTYTTSDQVRARDTKPSVSVYLGQGMVKKTNGFDRP